MMRELSPWCDPFSLVSSFRRDMDEFMSRFFGDWERAGTPWAPMGYYPPIESYVEGNTLHIKADLPGIDPQAVEITVEGNRLTVKGERKAEQEGKDQPYIRREVGYGRFARTFPLPEGVKAEEVQARYHQGVLDISIPLPASMVPKKVPVELSSEERKQIAA